jgi:hypothetical protein
MKIVKIFHFYDRLPATFVLADSSEASAPKIDKPKALCTVLHSAKTVAATPVDAQRMTFWPYLYFIFCDIFPITLPKSGKHHLFVGRDMICRSHLPHVALAFGVGVECLTKKI